MPCGGLRSADLGAHTSQRARRQLASRTDELRGAASGIGRPQAHLGHGPALDAHRRRRRRQDQARPAGGTGERPPVPRRRVVRRAGADPGPRTRPAGCVHGTRAPGPLVELGGLHPERLSRRQAAPADPRQLRARPRRRGRPGGNAAARLSRSADPRHQPPGPRGHRRGRRRRADAVAARGWSCVAGGPPPIGRRGPVRGARGRRPAGLRRRRSERRRDPAASARHLDGIPLALELAAVRLGALGLDALDRGLAARLGALGTGDRSASPRQQTLEGRSTGATGC